MDTKPDSESAVDAIDVGKGGLPPQTAGRQSTVDNDIEGDDVLPGMTSTSANTDQVRPSANETCSLSGCEHWHVT